MLEHRAAQEQENVSQQQNKVVCGCRFPCIPKNGSIIEALQQQEPQEKRQGVGGHQNTSQEETQQGLVRGHEVIRQGAGEQEETW